MTDRELMQQTLDALEAMQSYAREEGKGLRICDEAIEALRARLAQPEPVAWMWDVNNGGGYYSRGIGFEQTDIPFAKHTPLYTAPPQREWQELTRGEIADILCDDRWQLRPELMILAALEKVKEKNT